MAALFLAAPLSHAIPDPSPPTGPAQVRFIRFQGVKSFSDDELKRILGTKEKRFRWFTKAPLDDAVLAEDLERIISYYVSQGFYHARIVSHRVIPMVGDEVRVEIEIEEGPPMIISEVALSVNGDPSGPWQGDLLRLIPLQKGSRFTTPRYQDTEKAIVRFFSDWGYPKARAELSATLNKATNLAQVQVEVTTGPVCFFGAVTVEGNERVADEVILREVTFYPGDRFNGTKLMDVQQRLFGLDLFQFADVTVDGLEGEATTLPVRIVVKESKKQSVRVGVGYGTDEEFRGQLQYQVRNFLGDGRRLQINAKASSIVQMLEGQFYQPYFLTRQSYLNVDTGLENEDQVSFQNRRIYLTPTFNYRWTDRLSSFLGYDLETNRLMDVKVLEPLRGLEDKEREEYFVSSLLSGNSWERVDVPANPRRGVRLFETFEWAGEAIGSEVDYARVVLEARGYAPMGPFGVLATKLKWGGIQGIDNKRAIPIFKRFFAGGADSVRGYPYQKLGPLDENGNPIGGLTLIEGSLEWRFPLRKSFEGVLFMDFGNVFERAFAVLWDDLRYTAGCGLRYLTLVGPLRLDFGYQLNPPAGNFFNPYQVHFSIGQAF